MLNSRDISLLRDDVERNCRKMIETAKADGWNILVTGTVRDQEYQEYCYRNGTANTKYPSFHADHAGLAFDICKNKKGEEYSDPAFWKYCGALGKKMGFTWGGDWKSFPDKPHFQWDEHGKYTSTMIRAKKYPAPMPVYEEDDMSYEQFAEYMDRYLKEQNAKPESTWSKNEGGFARANAKIGRNGTPLMDGTKPQGFITREQLAAIMYRNGELD